MARRYSKPANTTVVVGEKRAARRSRRGSRRNRGGFGIKLTTEWILGFATAFAVPQNQMIDGAAMVLATAPVRGLGQARGAAMGYVCGQATQHIFLPKAGIYVPDFLGSALGTQRSTGNTV